MAAAHGGEGVVRERRHLRGRCDRCVGGWNDDGSNRRGCSGMTRHHCASQTTKAVHRGERGVRERSKGEENRRISKRERRRLRAKHSTESARHARAGEIRVLHKAGSRARSPWPILGAAGVLALEREWRKILGASALHAPGRPPSRVGCSCTWANQCTAHVLLNRGRCTGQAECSERERRGGRHGSAHVAGTPPSNATSGTVQKKTTAHMMCSNRNRPDPCYSPPRVFKPTSKRRFS